MDPDFEELYIPATKLDNLDLLQDGMPVDIVKWGDVVIGVNLPQSAEYQVSYTEPGLKKAASTGRSKPATLDTGAELNVPLYIDIGDVIKVKTESREFMERVSKKK